MESYDALHAFRHALYRCLHRRADALFELTDALLCAEAVPSPVHLSLQASHRRGWRSLYAALQRGRVDAEALRELLAHYYPLAGSGATTPVYAVDVSVWPSCDAQTSSDCGYYYHPSRHSAGQPIVAGWAYQFVAQLNFVHEGWTAPMDVARVRPEQEANAIAAEQIERLLGRSPMRDDAAYPCSSSMPARTPSSCSRDWREAHARSSSACAPDVASMATPASHSRPRTSDALVTTGRR